MIPSRSIRTIASLVPTLALTFLGLLLVTFLIGRVVPIDPVLAAVGDRAPPDVYERVDRARPAPAALAAVPDLRRQRPAGRLRQLGADRQPGARGHPPRLPGDPRARDRRDPPRRRARRARWACSPRSIRAACRPRDPRARPDRLLGAGVLARPGRPAALLRQLDWVAGPGPPRRVLRRTGRPGHRRAS